MKVWLDGLGVLADQSRAIVSMLLVVIWGQILSAKVFQKTFKNRLTNAEYFSLGMAGWLLPVALAVLPLFGSAYLLGEKMIVVVFMVAIILFLYTAWTEKPAQGSLLVYSVLIFFWVGSVFLHLVFLRKVIFPLYFDSAEHYRITKYFLGYFAASNGGAFPARPFMNYYHVGYHFLIASFSTLLQTNIIDTMLVSGQILVSVLPLSLFFITKRETGSNIAALFTSLLAGFGWHMPGYAVNWGKYPALFSLICIHFVLCIAYLIFWNNIFRLERPKLFWMLGLGVLVSGFIHTRSLIVYVFLALSLLLLLWWKRLPVLYQHISFTLVLGLLIVEIGCTRTDVVLRPLLNTYIHNDLLITGLVLFLAIFSAQVFVDVTFFSLAMLSLLFAGLFIPVDGLFPDYGNLVLLDRPYVQMLLYLPLSIIGGLGLAGLHQFVQRISFHSRFLSQLVTIVVFGCVVLNATFNHDYYPSSCCQIVGRDDLAAFDWMGKNLPLDANILIASTGMYVTSAEQADAQAGVDGGAWITPLISRKTIPMPSGLGFDKLEIRYKLCGRNSSYVYIGGEALSFNNALLEEHPAWYQVVLSLPGAKIYKVIGCR